MSALFDFKSFLTVVLLTICTCTFIKLSSYGPRILSEQTGIKGIFWKAARIGERASVWVAVGCCIMGIAVVFI